MSSEPSDKPSSRVMQPGGSSGEEYSIRLLMLRNVHVKAASETAFVIAGRREGEALCQLGECGSKSLY